MLFVGRGAASPKVDVACLTKRFLPTCDLLLVGRAPMSHVIDFFPPNIPRILINRNAVHPPSLAHDDDENDENEKEFRQDYIFDAYLLGFCDDVTRTLVKEMTQSNDSRGKEGGRLLACLGEGDERYTLVDWASTALPRDRVLLFPGALSGDSTFEYSYREIAHCDGCAEQIAGTIRKCKQCFDYDLCESCFPKMSLKHHGGTHAFSAEASGRPIV